MKLSKDEYIINGSIYSTSITKDIFNREQGVFIESVLQRELREEEEKEKKRLEELNEQEINNRDARFAEYLEECLLAGDIEAYENASLDDF